MISQLFIIFCIRNYFIFLRCLIPECESEDHIKFNTSWLTNAIPITSDSTIDSCRRYANVSSVSSLRDYCPGSLFNTQNVVPCDSYVYENTNTVVYEVSIC